MRPITHPSRSLVTPVSVSGLVTVWNRRLLIGALTLVLWAATILALHAASPDARAMLAGEGMLITATD